MKNKRKFKGNKKRKGPKNGICFNCGKPGHFSSQCRKKKGESSQQGKLTKEHGDYVKMVIESMMVDTNDKNWWIDSGATRHISRTKVGFVQFKEMKPRDQSIYMGNETFCNVLGAGKVKILLPTGKSLYLSDIFFAPAARRSVISVSQLAINEYEIRFKD